jgi:putative PIN family toxin of toxin-antitoxin system
LRAVLDANVLISALLAPTGASAGLLVRWLRGEFELVVSDTLLTELRRALAYRKLRSRISPEQANALIDLLQRSASLHAEPNEPPKRISRDPDDDYLLAFADTTDSILVTWDRDLLDLQELPVQSPAFFLKRLDESR